LPDLIFNMTTSCYRSLSSDMLMSVLLQTPLYGSQYGSQYGRVISIITISY